MRYLILVAVVGLALFTACAVTRVEYSPDGKLTAIQHKRFIINEEFSVTTDDWMAQCKSQPDPESVQVLKGALDAAKAVAK